VNYTIDLDAGEQRDLDGEWARLRGRAEHLRNRRADTPPDIDALLRDLEDAGFELADFLRTVNDARYAAEILHSRALNQALAKHGAVTKSVTVARAKAETDSLDEHATFLQTKAIYHHVEDIARALSRKHFGLMNTNKGIQGMLPNAGRRTT
jgi:hypothetical protein